MANEKRLIDANALLLEIEEELQYESPRFNAEQNKLIDMGLRIASKDIRHSPTVDAVEVVRCKDCKYQCTASCPTYYEDRMTYRDSWALDGDNDFCSYGERKTDE